jgi:hypothetical protein
MRRWFHVGWALGALLLGQGIASAQGGPPTPLPPATGGLSAEVKLSPAEEVTQADAIIARVESTRGTVSHQLADARAQRDVVKSLCLSDKLTQVDVIARSVTERDGSLKAAARMADGDLANHEFLILTVLRQRAEQLGAEANLCIGLPETFDNSGKSTTSQSVDPGMPSIEDSQAPVLTVLLEPPSCSSCFK